MKKRLASLITCTMIATSVMPSVAFGASFEDTINHWAEGEIDEWSQLGIIKGYDGMFRPNEFMTRGEFAVVLDRLMKYQKASNNNFSDLKDKYYTSAILKANYADIINGSDNTIRPEDKITREEAATILARAFNITLEKGNTSFADNDNISSWAMDSINTLQKLGYIQGKQDNKFEPKESITRGEIIKLFDNMTSKIYAAAGDYSENINGNVVINSEDVKLKNMTIDGDLIIAEGVAAGEIYLDKVTVTGNVYVKGGGENSIYFNDTTIKGTVLVNKDGGDIKIVATGETKIALMVLKSGAIVVTKDIEGTGINKLVIAEDILKGQEVVLQGEFNIVENNSKDVKLSIDGTIKELILNVSTEIKGEVVVDKISVSEGVKLTVNDKVIEGDSVDTTEASKSGGSGGSGGSGSSNKPGTTTGAGAGVDIPDTEEPDTDKPGTTTGSGLEIPDTEKPNPEKPGTTTGSGLEIPDTEKPNPEKPDPEKPGTTTESGLQIPDPLKPSEINSFSLTTGSGIFVKTIGSACTVKFIANGITTTETLQLSSNDKKKLPDAKAHGYEFVGWYTDKECTKLFKSDTEVSGIQILFTNLEPIK